MSPSDTSLTLPTGQRGPVSREPLALSTHPSESRVKRGIRLDYKDQQAFIRLAKTDTGRAKIQTVEASSVCNWFFSLRSDPVQQQSRWPVAGW